MPTLPSEAHRARQIAESFGAEADRYDRARPRYPDALIDRIVQSAPGSSLLDVGCGTGIAARQFQAAGSRVLGVEPDERMADFARSSGVDVEVATFEAWEVGGRLFDTVAAGMAWHWVDPVAGAVKAAQVLRPGGRISPFWYVFQPPAELGAAFSEVYRRVLPDSPFARGVTPSLDAYSAFFTKAEDGIAQSGAFGAPEQWRFDWDHEYTRGEWLEVVPTSGGHSRFTPDQQRQLLEGVSAAVDAAGGRFTMHFTAVVVSAVRN